MFEDEANLDLEDTIEHSRDWIELGYERDHAERVANDLVDTVRRTRDALGPFPDLTFDWVEKEADRDDEDELEDTCATLGSQIVAMGEGGKLWRRDLWRRACEGLRFGKYNKW